MNVRDTEQRREELYSDDGEGDRYLAEVIAEMREKIMAGRDYTNTDWEGKF